MSTINLLPEDYLERRAQHRANVLCLVLFSLVMVAVVAAAMVTEEKSRRTRIVREQVNRDYQEASRLIAQMQQLESKKKQVIVKAQVAADLLERVPRSYLLATLTKALPEGASLRDVTLKTASQQQIIANDKNTKFRSGAKARADASKAVERVPLKVTVDITGLAKNDGQVAQFITAMNKSSLMASVDLMYSEKSEYQGENVREFQVSMVLRRDAEAEFTSQATEAVPTPARAPADPLADARQ